MEKVSRSIQVFIDKQSYFYFGPFIYQLNLIIHYNTTSRYYYILLFWIISKLVNGKLFKVVKTVFLYYIHKNLERLL